MQRLQEQAQGCKRPAPLVTPHQFAVAKALIVEGGATLIMREAARILRVNLTTVRRQVEKLKRKGVLLNEDGRNRPIVALVDAVVVTPSTCHFCKRQTFLTRCCGQPTHNAKRGPR